MRNIEVAEAWRRGMPALGSNFRTDGYELFSYGLKIGYTDHKRKKIAIDYTAEGGKFVSMTTSKHVSYARRYADVVVPPWQPKD